MLVAGCYPSTKYCRFSLLVYLAENEQMNLYCFSILFKGNGHLLVGIHYTPTSPTRVCSSVTSNSSAKHTSNPNWSKFGHGMILEISEHDKLENDADTYYDSQLPCH